MTECEQQDRVKPSVSVLFRIMRGMTMPLCLFLTTKHKHLFTYYISFFLAVFTTFFLDHRSNMDFFVK